MTAVIICAVPPMVILIVTVAGKRRKQACGTGKTALTVPISDQAGALYDRCSMSAAQRIRYIAAAALVLSAGSYIFFKDAFICLAVSSLSLIYPKIKAKELVKRRKDELGMQFRDAIQAVSSSLSAGRSVENSFKAALTDLKIIYPFEQVDIIREFESICRRIDMNEPLEKALADFAGRSGVEDIKSFADVFSICISTGGNLVEVIKNASGIIDQKMHIRNEIDIIIAEQKLGQKILGLMPFVLMTLIMAGSPDYIKPLYSGGGHAIMGVVLLMLGISYYISLKITDIRV